jgi:hypothetical protein
MFPWIRYRTYLWRPLIGWIFQCDLPSSARYPVLMSSRHQLSRSRRGARTRDRLVLDGLLLALDNVTAKIDALITDEHVRPGDEMSNL